MDTFQVWTIGHSVLTLDVFLERLRSHRIELVADVRRHPVSSRRPQFERRALESALAEAGIRYRHFPGLGGRREPRPDSSNTSWKNEAFRGFADHMDTAEFREAAEALAEEARRERTAILCAEGDWKRCHRGLIADWFRDKLGRRLSGDGEVQLVLHDLEKRNRLRVRRRIISGKGKNFADTQIHPTLAGADVANALKEFVEIIDVPRPWGILEALVVKGEALYEILFQAGRGPLPELGAPWAAHAIADGEDRG